MFWSLNFEKEGTKNIFFFEFLIRYPGSAPMSRGTQRAQTNPDPHRGPPIKGRVLAKGHAAFPRLELETLG